MSKSKKPAANQIYQPPRAEVVRGEKTVDYFSPALTWLMAGAAARPFFTLIQAQAMLLDHQVWYGLQLRNAPLMQAKVKVTGPSAEINKFVQDQWDRFWQRCAPKVVATKYFGYAGFEPLYCEKNGLVEIDDLKDFSPADVRPLRQAGNGAFAGRIAGVSVRGQRRSMQGEPSYSPTRLFGKKGLWLSYDAVAGNPFGSSATYKAYGPWWDKAMPGGAYDLRRLRGCKDAWIGDIVRYPLNYTLMTPDGNKITGKDIARELAETRQSGGAMWIPSDKGADGTPLFEYEPPQTVADSTIIKSWIDDSDNEIFDGLLVPKEVVEAASSGSGFSGRSIPFVMFLAVCDIEFLGYVRAWKQQIGEALVIENFGVAANDFDMEPIPLVDIMADKMEGQAMGGPIGGASGGPPQPGQPGRPGDDGGAGPRGPGAGPREPAPGSPGLNLQFGSLFDEDEHPRAGDGKFASKAGGGRASARGGDSEPLFKTIKAGGDDTTKTRQKMLLSGLKSLAGQKDLFATDGERESDDEKPAPAAANRHNVPKFGTVLSKDEAAKLISKIRAGDSESKNKGVAWDDEPAVTGPMVVSKIPISELDRLAATDHPEDGTYLDYIRDSTDPARVEKYKNEGNDSPIVVVQSRKGTPIVSDGGHRLIAAIERGDKEIAAIVPQALHDKHHVKKPAAAPGMLFSAATETDEQTGRARWVTLNGGDGGDGARVLIGKDGYIYAGPSSMQGQKVQDLATNKQTRRKMADRKANQTKDRRSENKSAREGQLTEAIETAAADYGLDPDHLAESVDWIHSEALKRAEERETAKAQIRATTGLSQREINNLQNSHYDHASAHKVGGITGGKFKDFDQYAQQAARNYPELGLGDPDDPGADFSQALWDLLAEGKQDLPNKWDPEIIDEAVSLMRNAYPVDESDEFLEFSTSGDKPPGDRKKASAAAAGLRANETASAEIYRRLADLLKKN